jgi:cytochrome c-type biogenesis protein CcmE
MTPKKKQRLAVLIFGMSALAVAVGLVLTALEDNLVFFYSPTDIETKGVVANQRIRLGGMVADGSVVKNGEQVRFVVTDGHKEISVRYTGLLPDLFREGQGVVAEGYVQPAGDFMADEILAKHDENYMPPEVAEAMKNGEELQKPAGY